jgi:hypothetical protein
MNFNLNNSKLKDEFRKKTYNFSNGQKKQIIVALKN